jgi:hypothetical protein
LSWLSLSSIIPLVIGVVFATAALSFPGSNHGSAWWALGFLLQSLGFFFIFLRGLVPDPVSMPLANALIVAGPVLLLWGIEAYARKRFRPAFGLSWIAASVVLFVVVTYWQPSFNVRAFTVSTVLFGLNAIIGIRLLTLRGVARLQQGVTAGIFFASAAAMAVRAVLSIAGPAQSDIFFASPPSVIGLLEAFIAPIAIAIAFLSMVTRRVQIEREKTITKLEIALSTVTTLSGLLPICASCKKIRDENGHWDEVELYVRNHSKAEFSHSICPDCSAKLYPDLRSRDTEE